MINYCKSSEDAQVVAICDKCEATLAEQKTHIDDPSVAFYLTFDEFIKHDMDAVVLANYANEHAPFAIRCLNAGMHVFSEVLPVQTMKEAVELIEAVERSGKVYAYGENYCYIPSCYKMRTLYREGLIGEFEYGEGEYVHNCESIWPSITYGESEHWRNNKYATFYCTHSIGPLIHITGLRPVSVIGLEGTNIARGLRTGQKGGSFGIEMITLENGGIIKSIHGGLYNNSIWYSVYGSKGRMETGREDGEGIHMLYTHSDEFSGQYRPDDRRDYDMNAEKLDKTVPFGHGGSDYYSMYNFIEKLKGNAGADTIDVYEALDMFLPGMFAYRSVLNGGMTMAIPNLRNPEERNKWRNDTFCTDKKVGGEMYVPPFSQGELDIPESVYAQMKALWERELESKSGYMNAAFTQGAAEK
jgi:predicted dehydrogenase